MTTPPRRDSTGPGASDYIDQPPIEHSFLVQGESVSEDATELKLHREARYILTQQLAAYRLGNRQDLQSASWNFNGPDPQGRLGECSITFSDPVIDLHARIGVMIEFKTSYDRPGVITMRSWQDLTPARIDRRPTTRTHFEVGLALMLDEIDQPRLRDITEGKEAFTMTWLEAAARPTSTLRAVFRQHYAR